MSKWEGVCRGSIVLDKGHKFIVTRVSVTSASHNTRCFYTVELLPDDSISVGNSFFMSTAEPELVFPGVAFVLPDWVK